MCKKIKILIVSNTPWDDSNSFGSSFSNIFGGNINYDISNIYCQSGLPNTEICSRFFQISEYSIWSSLKEKNLESGKEVFNFGNGKKLDGNLLKSAKILRWQLFFWGRDMIWATGKWKSNALNDFIDSIQPDLIFQPIYYSSYVNEIGLYIQKRLNVPMIGYISDDNYTLKQFSLSPLFWVDRLIKRHFVKKAIDKCKILYTITKTQKEEYNKIFGNKCKVLFKGGNFDDDFISSPLNCPLKIVYTGNLGLGRWKSLAMIASCLKNINRENIVAQLFIYSQTPLSSNMKKKLDIPNVSFLMGSISADKVKYIQREADILVHVESFEFSERYKARLSFSTKIVDYLEAGKCILAVGWKKTGAIEYLLENDAAIVVSNSQEVKESLKKIVSDTYMMQEYAKKAYMCGKKNHQLEAIRSGLYTDILSVLK